MSTSQNGYEVLDSRTSGPFPRLRRWVVPGTGRTLTLRDGAVGFLLVHLALVLHDTVERLNIHGQPWDEWGWAPRPIRGSTTISNHASGTAMDLNATQHPLGKRGTFTRRQVKRIRYLLRVRYLGAIRWGGDYVNRADEMHYEAVKGLRACERRAKVLALTPKGRAILKANPGARKVIWS
jgi:hypothetical protein